MKRIALLLIAVVAIVCVVAARPTPSQPTDEADAAISSGKLPPGYRDWRLISVAREEGTLDDIRAILGNDVAIKAYREGTRPFPDGTVIARLAWAYLPSEENNKAFGNTQSFVAGAPKKRSPIHGQGLHQVRFNRRLGIFPVRRRQALDRPSDAPELL